MIGRHVAGLTESETIEALLGEGTSSLLAHVPRDDSAEFENSDDDIAQRRWEAELARWREEAEARCEGKIRERLRGNEGARPRDSGIEPTSLLGEFSSAGS